jgi:hypothetical protein
MSKMLRIPVISVLCISLLFSFVAMAQESITTEANFKTAIDNLGYEAALDKALKSGVLSMEQISDTVLANTQGQNPVDVIAVLVSYGVPQSDIINAASGAGISAGIIDAGLDRGNTMKSASTNQGTATEGLGFGEGLITPPQPPSVVTGRPGGRNPKDPISPSGKS